MTRLSPAPTAARPIARRPDDPADPVALSVAVATAYLEVRAGRRPPGQLDRLLTPDARRRLRVLVLRRRHHDGPSGGASVTGLRTSRPRDDAVEAVVVLRDGDGVVAVAVRVERHAGRWWVTDVGAPEDRQPLVPPGAPQPAPRRRPGA